VIKIEHLTKKFTDALAVDDLSFEVQKGEVIGFLGPNGAGKTTTMRMLTGFIPPTQGKITIAGYDVFSDSLATRKLIGYLPENTPLYQDMRVEEYLNYRARLKRVPKNKLRENVNYAMEKCWITDVRHKIIGHLSKGYKQRVGLADSLLHDPKILILDEPTIGLDPNQIRQVRDLIKELGKEHTIILSTHILPEVEMICSRVIIINKGKIAATDTPQNLMKRNKNNLLKLEVKGNLNTIKDALQKIEAINTVSVFPTINKDIHKFSLEYSYNQDIREDVFNTIVESKATLREMRLEKISLEDIFVQITTEEEEPESD